MFRVYANSKLYKMYKYGSRQLYPPESVPLLSFLSGILSYFLRIYAGPVIRFLVALVLVFYSWKSVAEIMAESPLTSTLTFEIAAYILALATIILTAAFCLEFLIRKFTGKRVNELCSIFFSDFRELIDVDVEFYGRCAETTDEMEGL